MEPLGLPRGSVRAALALLLTACTALLFGRDGQVPDALLAVTVLVDGFYFGWRTASVPVPPETAVEAPSLPPPVWKPEEAG